MAKTWNDITLYKFQQIEEIQKRDIPQIERNFFSACMVFDYTENQFDDLPPEQALKLAEETIRIYQSPLAPLVCRWFGFYRVQFTPAALTLGQYIELCFFLQPLPGQKDNDAHIRNGHYILATLCRVPIIWRWFFNDHPTKKERFLRLPVAKVIGTLLTFIKNFNEFNAQYSGLFGLQEETDEEVKTDRFNTRYGWIYSASQVAEYQRITLEQAFKLPVREALNALMYLKEKVAYEDRMANKK